MKSRFSRLAGVLVLVVALLLGGCVSRQAYLNGEKYMEAGNYDAAVAQYQRSVRQDPDTDKFRAALERAKIKAGWTHLEQGRDYLKRGELARAKAQFLMALEFDPTLETASAGVKQAEDRLQGEQLAREAEQFFRQRRFVQARRNLDEALLLYPDYPAAKTLLAKVQEAGKTLMAGHELDVASDKPITLKFKDAQIRDVFGILSKLSGINFLFDEDLKDQKVSVLLEDASFAQALELLLKMNDLGMRVLNGKTVIIYSNTRDKEKQYQDQVIQTFYLSNIDAKKAVNLLRTMLQLRKIYVHEELNALVIRDKPEVVKLAQEILEAADREDAEVIYEMELLETSDTDNLTLGPKLSQYGTALAYVNPGTETIPEGSVTVSGLSKLQALYTIPTAQFDLVKTLTNTEILANPKIRVKNKEKAKVHIGSREPVITVTTTGTDTRSDSIQYVDVGVKLEVEPTVQLDHTVVTKVSLEVSNVTSREKTKNETLALSISTTNASTSLTLKDGERTILGGLMRDDYSNTVNSIPLLGRLPFIGPLLSSHSKTKTKREILLSITPHIVQSLRLPRADVAQIWSGGEDDLKAGPSFAAFAHPLEADQAQPAPVPAPGVQESPAPLPTAVPEARSTPAPPAAAPAPAAPAPAPMSAPPEVKPAAPAATDSGQPAAVVPVPQVSMPGTQAAGVADQTRLLLRGPTLVKVGEEFTVDIAVDGAAGLYSAPFFLNFPPGNLEFVRAEEGDLLGRDGTATIFTTSVNRTSGQLIVGTKQGAGGAGASGAGTLARVVFKAKAPGKTLLTLDRINFRDTGGRRLPVEAASLAIEVH